MTTVAKNVITQILQSLYNVISTLALRPAIETLVINASNDPENVNAPNAQEDKTIQVRIKNLSQLYILIS